jgi:hypothetical protein
LIAISDADPAVPRCRQGQHSCASTSAAAGAWGTDSGARLGRTATAAGRSLLPGNNCALHRNNPLHNPHASSGSGSGSATAAGATASSAHVLSLHQMEDLTNGFGRVLRKRPHAAGVPGEQAHRAPPTSRAALSSTHQLPTPQQGSGVVLEQQLPGHHAGPRVVGGLDAAESCNPPTAHPTKKTCDTPATPSVGPPSSRTGQHRAQLVRQVLLISTACRPRTATLLATPPPAAVVASAVVERSSGEQR